MNVWICMMCFCSLRNPLSKDVCDVTMRGCWGKRKDTHANNSILDHNPPELLMKAVRCNIITALMKDDIVSNESNKEKQRKLQERQKERQDIKEEKREGLAQC